MKRLVVRGSWLVVSVLLASAVYAEEEQWVAVLEQMETENEELETKAAVLQARVGELEGQLGVSAARVTALEAENEYLKTAKAQLEGCRPAADLTNDVTQLSLDLEEQQNRVKFLELNIGKLKAEIEAAQARADYAEKSAAQSEQIVTDVKKHNMFLWWALAICGAIMVSSLLSLLRKLRIFK